MKTAKLLFASFSLMLIFFFSRCTPDHNFNSPTSETLTSSNWSVDYYFASQDLTGAFGGYSLYFSSTGSIAATKGNIIILGNWSNGMDANKNEIITINLSTTDPNLNKLSEGWKLVSQTLTTLQFEQNAHTNNPTQFRIRKE
ncbi:MAG TPA: hypothetical protein VET23_10415 [Chitinophagaceae bacterium]|nr:hypothetical protein [Chitinophagaceae bacterium]